MKIIKETECQVFELIKGQELVIYDILGQQVADLCAFAIGDKTEWISNGRTFDYEGTIFLTKGNRIYSNKSNVMFTIVEDSVGKHDFLYTPCSQQMYEIQYGATDPHPNCLENLTKAFSAKGLEGVQIPTPFNVFMNVSVNETGRLEVLAPISNAGDAVKFRAEMDLVVAISACPAGLCNGGSQKPIGFEIVG